MKQTKKLEKPLKKKLRNRHPPPPLSSVMYIRSRHSWDLENKTTTKEKQRKLGKLMCLLPVLRRKKNTHTRVVGILYSSEKTFPRPTIHTARNEHPRRLRQYRGFPTDRQAADDSMVPPPPPGDIFPKTPTIPFLPKPLCPCPLPLPLGC